MTNQEILEKAFRKARENGWARISEDADLRQFANANWPETYIYDHDFAKALWGEEIGQDMKSITDHTSREQYIRSLVPAWQFHLQMMIIADDPIKYLGEHL